MGYMLYQILKQLYESALLYLHYKDPPSPFRPLEEHHSFLKDCDFFVTSAALQARPRLKTTFLMSATLFTWINESWIKVTSDERKFLFGSKWIDLIHERNVWQIIWQQVIYICYHQLSFGKYQKSLWQTITFWHNTGHRSLENMNDYWIFSMQTEWHKSLAFCTLFKEVK